LPWAFLAQVRLVSRPSFLSHVNRPLLRLHRNRPRCCRPRRRRCSLCAAWVRRVDARGDGCNDRHPAAAAETRQQPEADAESSRGRRTPATGPKATGTGWRLERTTHLTVPPATPASVFADACRVIRTVSRRAHTTGRTRAAVLRRARDSRRVTAQRNGDVTPTLRPCRRGVRDVYVRPQDRRCRLLPGESWAAAARTLTRGRLAASDVGG
jgi:hypothetical protein